ncbi:uncharacterized protein LOC129760560 [Uranotaenia lowii]|uniref:uncharacterized protein LOC129760560 n=1 Tax=Uranotaenia lowii TaxID=190385 RepID=UPI0024795E27|nr:uncharacterized protein LOC129760560 [Uranotaenia lowii]
MRITLFLTTSKEMTTPSKQPGAFRTRCGDSSFSCQQSYEQDVRRQVFSKAKEIEANKAHVEPEIESRKRAPAKGLFSFVLSRSFNGAEMWTMPRGRRNNKHRLWKAFLEPSGCPGPYDRRQKTIGTRIFRSVACCPGISATHQTSGMCHRVRINPRNMEERLPSSGIDGCRRAWMVAATTTGDEMLQRPWRKVTRRLGRSFRKPLSFLLVAETRVGHTMTEIFRERCRCRENAGHM